MKVIISNGEVMLLLMVFIQVVVVVIKNLSIGQMSFKLIPIIQHLMAKKTLFANLITYCSYPPIMPDRRRVSLY